MSVDEQRFQDPEASLHAYADPAFVECPRCARAARVTGEAYMTFPLTPIEARVHCLSCSFFRDFEDHSFVDALERDAWWGPYVGMKRRACPKCGHQWVQASEERERLRERPRPVTTECERCEATVELDLNWSIQIFTSKPIDPWFGMPLWLQTRCCNTRLWAYNRKHLNRLRGFIGAKHRERGRWMRHWSMVSRLPQWMKRAKHREEVLDALEELERRLDELEQK